MDQQQQLLNINMNPETYRNLSATNQPSINDKHLEVILVHKDGSLILGASNMVDRYWNGSVWYFNDASTFDRNRYTATVRTESGVCCSSYLERHDKFVIGEDSGLLQVFELINKTDNEDAELQCIGYSCQHDNSLTSVATFHDNNHIVTGGMDNSLKVWDTAEMIAVYSFDRAHCDAVTSVQVQSGSNSVFLSTSLDSEALLWDTRKSRPATSLLSCKHGLTAASWKINDENTVAIGELNGNIMILDIRSIKCPVHEFEEFPRSIHKLLFNPESTTQLASCCDSTEVKIFDVSNKFEKIFENNSHKDFVRDLAWLGGDLITCSWDNTILRHSLKS